MHIAIIKIIVFICAQFLLAGCSSLPPTWVSRPMSDTDIASTYDSSTAWVYEFNTRTSSGGTLRVGLPCQVANAIMNRDISMTITATDVNGRQLFVYSYTSDHRNKDLSLKSAEVMARYFRDDDPIPSMADCWITLHGVGPDSFRRQNLPVKISLAIDNYYKYHNEKMSPVLMIKWLGKPFVN